MVKPAEFLVKLSGLAKTIPAKMHSATRMKTSFVTTLLLASSCSLMFAAGKQITGQHAPTATPALSPAEAQKKFVVPEGFEVRLFAAEPDVINPVAMTWDERGRLWVLELYEYPLGAPAGQKGRDRIRILEDTDNDGRADKVTVFADGLNLATGLLLGNGGAYVGQAPDLLFLSDTNHDDKADKREVLLTGFGLQDRHELLNGFTWGPDGWLYLTHGVFTHSKVKIPEASEPGVEVTAAVARFHPRTKKFEVFAEGTSNPWGVDFDAAGNAFVSACVIDHLFHMAPGGTYQRQAGTPSNPYAYEILPSIVDHKHHMAAYCGICVYQGDQFPAEYQGRVFMGNIHQNAINHDRLIPQGASFKAVAEKDLLTTTDGWFRPISQQVGPDGALWIGDWCDKYPCYQNAQADPEGVDRERGRIWRVVYVGKEKGKKVQSRPDVKMDLSKLPYVELIARLDHGNVWQRRTAQRVLMERFINTRWSKAGIPTLADNLEYLIVLENTLNEKKSVPAQIAAFWALREINPGWEKDRTGVDDWLDKCMAAWRIAAEGDNWSPEAIAELETLANDSDPRVQFAVATAVRRIVSSRLVTNYEINDTALVGKVLANLTKSAASAKDPLVNYMIWLSSEPLLARNPGPGLRWLAQNGTATKPLSGILTRKAMRRLCDTGEAVKVDQAAEFLAGITEKDTDLTLAALDGLIEGQKARSLPPTTDTKALFAKLNVSDNAQVKDRARQLGTLWNDVSAVQLTLALINNPQAPLAERIQAVQTARSLKSDAARDAVLALLARENPEPLTVEAIHAVGELGGNAVATDLLGYWPRFTPAARAALADILVSRRGWATALLSAIGTKAIAVSDLPLPTVRRLVESKDEFIQQLAAQTIGRVRPANADKQKLIAQKKQMVLNGTPDLPAGHELAKQHCLTCHKLNGEGAEVGPDLTGSGRSSLDALLANVIDPNQIIGKGFENVMIETKDDRSLSGRLAEDTPSHVKLLSAGPKEEVVSKSDIASMRVSEFSVMPEGLEQMPDADFRNLISYLMNATPEPAK